MQLHFNFLESQLLICVLVDFCFRLTVCCFYWLLCIYLTLSQAIYAYFKSSLSQQDLVFFLWNLFLFFMMLFFLKCADFWLLVSICIWRSILQYLISWTQIRTIPCLWSVHFWFQEVKEACNFQIFYPIFIQRYYIIEVTYDQRIYFVV